ncbi:MAG TPA: MarR family transcriptional regulator, partial [Chloroflexota bacterium]|nr:MarR family transcriptional regulator [Chloroflexota bacterium]
AEALQMPTHAISRKLDSLERGGFLERTLDPGDARKRVLTITEKGKRVLQEASRTMNEEVERMLSVLEPEALEGLLTSLEALAALETV